MPRATTVSCCRGKSSGNNSFNRYARLQKFIDMILTYFSLDCKGLVEMFIGGARGGEAPCKIRDSGIRERLCAGSDTTFFLDKGRIFSYT